MILDRLVAVYKGVEIKAFEKFVSLLEYHEQNGLIEKVEYRIGKRISEYHHNFLIGDSSAGRVHMAYKHNTAKNNELKYDLRVEFNPSKVKGKERLFDLIQFCFSYKGLERTLINVTMMELAVDVEAPVRSVLVFPKHGREENRIQGNKYFGMRGRHGRLKVYDKKREREEKGFKVDLEHLTRIEYTWKDKIKLERLEQIKLGANELYDIKILGGSKMAQKAEVQAYILAIAMGSLQLKDFTRTNQRHIKEALANMETLGFEGMFDYRLPEIKRDIYNLLVENQKNPSRLVMT